MKKLSKEEQARRVQNIMSNSDIDDETLSHHSMDEKIEAIKWSMKYRKFSPETIDFVNSVETYYNEFGRVSPKQAKSINQLIANNQIEV